MLPTSREPPRKEAPYEDSSQDLIPGGVSPVLSAHPIISDFLAKSKATSPSLSSRILRRQSRRLHTSATVYSKRFKPPYSRFSRTNSHVSL